MKVRVRYAPSPTGLQHIGGVRTALYNYFFAKSQGGTFFLRIEDTDQGRYDERAVDDIYETFKWLGINLDEGPREGGAFGPYVQSERIELYHRHAEKLLESGHAYHCFCTAEELDQMRKEQAAAGLPVGYDRRCRNLSRDTVEENLKAGKRHVLRFKIPLEGQTRVNDVLLGTVDWPNKDVSADPVILKADGFPTYHLAHVVDDHLMETSHVLRAQEWLPSAPLHVLMFEALGWDVPLYCHLSMIMGSDGHKLSKRHGSTSAQDFRNGGYVREAIINYVTLLGWSLDGETEIFSRETLEKVFTLEKLSKAPAIFDYQKLDYFNGQWIRELPDTELVDRIWPWLSDAKLVEASGGEPVKLAKDRNQTLAAMPIVKERLHKLSGAAAVMAYIFRDPDFSDPQVLSAKKQGPAEIRDVLARLAPELEGFESRSDEENEARFHALAEAWGMKLGQVMMPLRLAVTGSQASPPLMPSIRLLGVSRCVDRIRAAAAALESRI